MADSELFEEAKKGLLEEGLMGFLDSKMKIPTYIRLNPDTYYIEWLEDRKTKTLILCHYLFHNRLDSEGIIGLEINLQPANRFLPLRQEFFFSSEQTLKKLELFLNHSGQMTRQMTYTKDLLAMFQHREFHSLLQDLDAKEVPKREVKRYFKYGGINFPKGYFAEKADSWQFEDWKSLYNEKMSDQESIILEDVFNKFSTCPGETEQRIMTLENLADFLKRHQQEAKQPTDEDLLEIMRRHMERVSLIGDLLLSTAGGLGVITVFKEYPIHKLTHTLC